MKKAVPLILASLLAGTAQGADLLSVYRDAVVNDAQFAAARATLEAGRERVPQARAGLLPLISLSGNVTRNDTETTFRQPTISPSGRREFTSDGYTLALSQPVFRWQNYVQYRQAQLQVVQAEAQFEQARQDLILRVAQAYFDVLLAQESLELARAQKTAIAEQLEQAKRNFEVGTATITDTHEAQARYDLANAQEIAAESDLSVRRHALRQLIGREPEALEPLRPDIRINPPQPPEMGRWVEAAEQSNYLVQAARLGAEVAAQEVERRKAGHLPTLDLVATHGGSGSGSSSVGVGSDSQASTIGLQLSLPLYAGGGIVSATNEAAALRDRALADLEQTRRSAAQTARQAFLGVSSGLARVSALEQALVSSQSALESNRLGYEVGVRINIDVLNAQQQLYATRRDLASARYDTLLAQLRLRAASAGLSEVDVEQVNRLLGDGR